MAAQVVKKPKILKQWEYGVRIVIATPPTKSFWTKHDDFLNKAIEQKKVRQQGQAAVKRA